MLAPGDDIRTVTNLKQLDKTTRYGEEIAKLLVTQPYDGRFGSPYCRHCGRESRRDEKFCANCGASIADPTPQTEKPESRRCLLG